MKIAFRLFVLGFVLLIAGCSNPTKETQTDALRFKEEYESVNGTKSPKGNTYISLSIDNNNPVKYITEEDVLNLENGIVLFGFPTCPWCRNTIEPLLDFAQEEKISIYYLNIAKIRDQKELQKDGTIITKDEGTQGYQYLLKKFNSLLDPYKGLGNDSIKRIVSSTVLFIKNNKGFRKKSGTVESQKDPYIKLTADQHTALKQQYKDIFVAYKNETE